MEGRWQEIQTHVILLEESGRYQETVCWLVGWNLTIWWFFRVCSIQYKYFPNTSSFEKKTCTTRGPCKSSEVTASWKNYTTEWGIWGQESSSCPCSRHRAQTQEGDPVFRLLLHSILWWLIIVMPASEHSKKSITAGTVFHQMLINLMQKLRGEEL